MGFISTRKAMSTNFWKSNFWLKAQAKQPFKLLRTIYWWYIKKKVSIQTFFFTKKIEKKFQHHKLESKSYPFGELYISLTSFPARLQATYFAICSLFAQDTPANKIILTLAKDEFPNGEKDIPQKILDFQKKGLEILWCDENLKPHNKYFYAMKKYPKAIIITADDDILYPSNTVSKLIATYKKHPHAICALGVRQITVENEQPKAFCKWNANLCYEPYRISKELLGQERMDFLAEGGSSVLYPPSIMPQETFNIEKIKQLAPYADDIWLKCMQLLANIPVVCYNNNQKVFIISFSQNVGLYKINMENNQNDAQFLAILEAYKEHHLLEKISK